MDSTDTGVARPSGPRISVVVPFHNEKAFLQRCVAALLNQKFPRQRRQIILVDSGSSDGSAELVRHGDAVQVVRSEQPGSYLARNLGLRHAQGEIIAFTDGDCEVASDWLQRIDDAFTDPDVGVVLGRRAYAGGRSGLELIAAYEEAKARYVFDTDDRELYFGYTNNMAVRASLIRGRGFLERQRGSDTIWVRDVVDRYGCTVVRYDSAIRIRHLEIQRLPDYYRKMFLYGRSRQLYRPLCATRSLTAGERWRVFRAATKGARMPRTQSALLFVALSGGLLAWWGGSLSASRIGE